MIGVANRRSTSVLMKSVLFWPWTMPAKLQVLALDEDAGVQEHVQQEPCLALGEAERRDGLHALGDWPGRSSSGLARAAASSDQLLRDSRVRRAPSAAAATADRASDREIAGESRLGRGACVAAFRRNASADRRSFRGDWSGGKSLAQFKNSHESSCGLLLARRMPSMPPVTRQMERKTARPWRNMLYSL